MSQEFQLLNYDEKLKGVFSKAEKNLSQENLLLIQRYDNEMTALGFKKSTRVKQLSLLVNMSIRIGKSWEQVTKSDIDNLIRGIIDEYGDNLGSETETTRDYKKSLKPFFRWLKFGCRDRKEVGDPPELRSIHLKKVKDKIIREQLLTEEDHKKLLESCSDSARDRAFLDVHYEAGTRPGEILSLKIKHVKFDDHGAVIHVDGKTGPRPVRIISSVPNLAKWLEIHPLKNNPESPLWIMFDSKNFGKHLSYPGARALLQRRLKRSKIIKRVNLKLFRHSEATRLSKFLPESTMRLRHGWTKGSDMPSRYVHLVQTDVDEKILEMYGIKKIENKEKMHLPRKCLICEMPNTPDSESCCRCGRSLDLKSAIIVEEKSKEHNFNVNKMALKLLLQMLQTGQIPKVDKNELEILTLLERTLWVRILMEQILVDLIYKMQ